jgi:hypothetical protein
MKQHRERYTGLLTAFAHVVVVTSLTVPLIGGHPLQGTRNVIPDLRHVLTNFNILVLLH